MIAKINTIYVSYYFYSKSKHQIKLDSTAQITTQVVGIRKSEKKAM